MSNNKLRSLLLGFMFLLPAISASAQATSATPEADALYAAEKWNEAAPAYEALTKTHSNDGRVWYRLGYSLHLMGKYEESARAFQRSVEIGNNPLVMYNLACAYARLGEKDKAFEWNEHHPAPRRRMSVTRELDRFAGWNRKERELLQRRHGQVETNMGEQHWRGDRV